MHKKKNRANKLKARDGEERTSPFVTFSWVITVFDLLFVVLRSKAVEPMFFLLLLSIRFHFRLPFVVVDKKQQSSESEGGREREREREREKERGRERERERQRERQTER